MIDIKRILCPVDFSDTSRHALADAMAIARWYDSEVFALQVVHSQFMTLPPLFMAPLPPELGSMEERRGHAETELRRWIVEAKGDAVKTHVLFDEGAAATSILEHASNLPADLIVMGTHGLSGFDHLVLGSVTERVLRKAACPVMTVPPRASAIAHVPYTRILCPIDFSDSSLRALRYAMSLAQEADAHLTLLHVLEWAEPPTVLEQYNLLEYHRDLEADARKRLEALVSAEDRVWCKPAIRIALGRAYREILDIARTENTDLIVIGVRGRNAVDLSLFGSTTNHVVRQASCPVLTLRH